MMRVVDIAEALQGEEFGGVIGVLEDERGGLINGHRPRARLWDRGAGPHGRSAYRTPKRDLGRLVHVRFAMVCSWQSLFLTGSAGVSVVLIMHSTKLRS